MSRIVVALTMLAVAAMAGSAAFAVDYDWNNQGDSNAWNNPDNWNLDAVPGDGNTVRFFGGPKGKAIDANHIADLMGATINMPNSLIGMYMGSEGGFRIEDTGGGGEIICDVFHVQQGGRPAYEVDVPVTAMTQIQARYRLGSVKFYKAITAPVIDLGRGDSVYIYGDANATTKFWININDNTTNAYLQPHPDTAAVPTLTTPLLAMEGVNSTFYVNGYVDANEIQLTDGARYFAQRDGALGDGNTVVSVTNLSYLKLDAAQTSLAQITAGGFGVLDGDFTGGVYGTNVTLNEDAILANTTNIPLPTEADLGLAAGVKDAKVWKGVTSDGTFEYGDDGNSAWKGTAFGSFTSGDLGGKRLVAPAGAGDLEVVWLSGAPSGKNANGFYMDTLDRTGVANIALYSALNVTGGTINQNPDANSVTTFNLTSHSTTTNTDMFIGGNAFSVRDDQTFNFIGAGRVYTDQDDMHGQLSVSGEAMYKFTGTPFLPTGTDPNVKLTFGGGTMLSFGSGDVLDLEQLSPSQIVVHPDAMLGLETYGDWWNSGVAPDFSPQFNITDANNPNLVAIMKSVNVVTYSNNNNYADLQGDGIQLGDGKFWLHYGNIHKGLILRADPNHPNAMVHGAGPGATMGIGVASNNGSEYLTVVLPIDANGATVLLNSTDSFTVATPGQNARYTGEANRRLELAGPIHNAAEVVVQNSGVYIIDDAIDSGTLLGALLPVRVADNGDLQFQNSPDADGFMVSNLDKTQITIDQGGRVLVDNDMSVNSMVLNSTYTINADGLQINTSDDDLTITGRLSGDGAWGDDGQLIIASTAVIAPGNGGTGELGGNNLTLANGATYEWQLAAAGDYDTVTLTGNVTFDGLFNIDVENLGAALTGTEEFIIMSADGAFSGNFDANDVFVDAVLSTGWTGTVKRVANGGDWDLVLSELSSGVNADTNGDGVVDATDYIALKRNLGNISSGAGLADGDLDGDGDVDWDDLTAMNTALNAAAGANTIPEPATMGLLAIGALALVRRRRRS